MNTQVSLKKWIFLALASLHWSQEVLGGRNYANLIKPTERNGYEKAYIKSYMVEGIWEVGSELPTFQWVKGADPPEEYFDIIARVNTGPDDKVVTEPIYRIYHRLAINVGMDDRSGFLENVLDNGKIADRFMFRDHNYRRHIKIM